MDAKARLHLMTEKMVHNADNAKSDSFYKPQKGDIIIVGPPKSGTTWMQQIVHQIRTKGDETFDDIYNVTRFIGNMFDTNVNGEQVCIPRVFKHHMSYGLVPTIIDQKHLVIIRDPYDAAYSWLKFRLRRYGDEADVDDEEAANHFEELRKKNIVPSVEIISTWWQYRNDDNIHFLFYEDLLKDLKDVIKRISTFIEIPLMEEELKYVTYLSSFEYMLQHKEKFQGDVLVSSLASALNIERWTSKMGMVREDGGKIGQGKLIGPKLRIVIDKLWQEYIKDVHGYTTYEEMYNKNTLFPQLL